LGLALSESKQWPVEQHQKVGKIIGNFRKSIKNVSKLVCDEEHQALTIHNSVFIIKY